MSEWLTVPLCSGLGFPRSRVRYRPVFNIVGRFLAFSPQRVCHYGRFSPRDLDRSTVRCIRSGWNVRLTGQLPVQLWGSCVSPDLVSSYLGRGARGLNGGSVQGLELYKLAWFPSCFTYTSTALVWYFHKSLLKTALFPSARYPLHTSSNYKMKTFPLSILAVAVYGVAVFAAPAAQAAGSSSSLSIAYTRG